MADYSKYEKYVGSVIINKTVTTLLFAYGTKNELLHGERNDFLTFPGHQFKIKSLFIPEVGPKANTPMYEIECNGRTFYHSAFNILTYLSYEDFVVNTAPPSTKTSSNKTTMLIVVGIAVVGLYLLLKK